MITNEIEYSESFSSNYSSKVLDTIPSSDEVLYYPGANYSGGRDGIIVKVDHKNGLSWSGVFAFGRNGGSAITGVYHCPNPDILCVISCGDGFFVWANDPKRWEEIDSCPVNRVIILPEHNIIAFCSDTDVTAYGKNGLAWVTQRLAWSGMEITTVNPDAIEGRVWDIRSEQYICFSIDPVTGHHTGGIEEI